MLHVLIAISSFAATRDAALKRHHYRNELGRCRT